ncbi:glycoside hydrolase family 16 protein [Gelidibacter salicanalis]|uniref:Glycoside hydrolase family 16 protein n=1 Tax=Gelidibacter salicanalis TaxID=291193 RepID=A0A934KVL7_9FLAO|nr:glycoside hydrolase family 16 protein [Gelidibacter salicanalis]MBJ7881658.1 glycoside hydrolase family 16 protein [Gelidibacter salicanalis]
MSFLIKPVIIFLFWVSVAILTSCSTSESDTNDPPTFTTRIIKFSGFEWIVRTSDEKKQGPGPNLFSDSADNVWVDEYGRLHLKIVQRNGHWYCAGVTLKHSQGHKKYVFYLSSRIDELDENVVGGLFTYKNDNEEIDIEFSRWSKFDNQNTQYAIQPGVNAGNKYRYDMDLTSNLSTHFFDWKAKEIEFGSYEGHTLNPEDDAIINAWTYTGSDIPPLNDERLKLNLWLFRGQSPTNSQPAEMIIERIEIL